jgi:TonB family protein
VGPTALGNPLTWVPPVAFMLTPGTPEWVRLLILGLGLLSVLPELYRRMVDPAAPPFRYTALTGMWMVALVLLWSILTGIANGSSADGGVDVEAAPVATAPADVAPAPPAPGSPGYVYELDQVDVVPELENPDELARALAAGYPARLRDAGVVGRVTVGFTVDTLGTTGSGTRWVSGTADIAFVQPALDAVKVMRFRPALKDGRKVPVKAELPITFTSPGSP